MLTDTERRVLEFEAAHLRQTAHQQAGVGAFGLGFTSGTYCRSLAALLATPDAVEEFPQLAAWHERAADARA